MQSPQAYWGPHSLGSVVEPKRRDLIWIYRYRPRKSWQNPLTLRNESALALPTLVIRVPLVQLFGLMGQSRKVDGSFAPTRASSTADSQLAIYPSQPRVYSLTQTQAGLLAKAALQPTHLSGRTPIQLWERALLAMAERLSRKC
ncbi:protein of unknown function [Pseudomonas mediterranea]